MRGITRREGLLAVAVLGPAALVAACTTSSEPATSSADASSTVAGTDAPTPDDIAGAEAALVARYDATLAALPDAPPEVRDLLSAIREQHAAHLVAVGGTPADPAESTAGGTVPSTTQAALAALMSAEKRAARDRVRACTTAESPDLARTLAFIAASEASHVPALRQVRA